MHATVSHILNGNSGYVASSNGNTVERNKLITYLTRILALETNRISLVNAKDELVRSKDEYTNEIKVLNSSSRLEGYHGDDPIPKRQTPKYGATIACSAVIGFVVMIIMYFNGISDGPQWLAMISCIISGMIIEICSDKSNLNAIHNAELTNYAKRGAYEREKEKEIAEKITVLNVKRKKIDEKIHTLDMKIKDAEDFLLREYNKGVLSVPYRNGNLNPLTNERNWMNYYHLPLLTHLIVGGACTFLEGPGGAYINYETLSRQDAIINSLEQFSSQIASLCSLLYNITSSLGNLNVSMAEVVEVLKSDNAFLTSKCNQGYSYPPINNETEFSRLIENQNKLLMSIAKDSDYMAFAERQKRLENGKWY